MDTKLTSISANAIGLRNVASRKINHIARPLTIITRQQASVNSKLPQRLRNVGC